MTSEPRTCHGRAIVRPPSAPAFVAEQLELAAGVGFDGPLARRLRALTLGRPFGLVPPEALDRAGDPRHGGIGAAQPAVAFAAAVSTWLGEAAGRSMVFEESLGRRTDAVARRASHACGDHVYSAVASGASPEQVAEVCRRVSGYPGVGVVAETVLEGFELSVADLDRLVAHARAMLVRAWDDEGWLIAPVEG